MRAISVASQSPKAYDLANLSAAQLGARLAAGQNATLRTNLRTALQDSAYRYLIHPAETAAGLTNANLTFGYDLLNAARYGLATAASAATNTTALANAILVLAQLTGAELLIPAGVVAQVNTVVFNAMSNFNVRCDGKLVSALAQQGTAFTDERSTYAGVQSVLQFRTCSQFKVYGSGHVDPMYSEPVFLATCNDFDYALDCRGTGLNSTLCGVYIRYCYNFRFRDCVIDSITAQNMNNSTEVYYAWLNNIQIWDSYEFQIVRVTSRKAGMNGIYPASNCYDFSIDDCQCEYNAGSGIQPAWSSFGAFPVRFRISKCRLYYNQADGIDCNNTSGSLVAIYAQFTDNYHVYNGWLNCNPANAPGSDGSGMGTYISVQNFTVLGGSAYEPAHTGIYLDLCSQWRAGHFDIVKTNTGSAADGVFITGGTSGTLECADIRVLGTLNALNMQSTNDVTIRECSFDGLWSVASGAYVGCRAIDCRITCYNQLTAYFPLEHCDVIVSNASQNGIFAGTSNLSFKGCTVTATNIGIVANGSNVNIEDNIVSAPNGIYSAAGSNIRIRGNEVTATTGPGIHLDTTCNQCEISGNTVSSASGNSILTGASTTLTARWGNVVSGPTSYAGTTTITF